MSLAPSHSRLLALGLLLLILTASALSIAQVIDAWRGNEEAIAQSQNLLEQFSRIAATRPRLEARLQDLRKAAQSQDGLLEGANPSVAGAKLQGEIKRIVEAGGGEIKSAQILPPADEAGFQRIGLRVDLVATIASLQKFLLGLEADVPRFFVENLDVRAAELQRANFSPETPIPLAIRCDVIAYLRVPSQ